MSKPKAIPHRAHLCWRPAETEDWKCEGCDTRLSPNTRLGIRSPGGLFRVVIAT